MSKKIRSMEVDLEIALLDCVKSAIKGREVTLQDALDKEVNGEETEKQDPEWL